MNFHPQREALLAEVHARPSSPIEAPTQVTRAAVLSGQDGAERDRLHMADLCRQVGVAMPASGMRWWSAQGDGWQLRWERHSEFSSWTLSRRPGEEEGCGDLAPLPPDWIAALPGAVLVLTTIELRLDASGIAVQLDRQEAIGTILLDGAATLHTDLRPDATGVTCFDVTLHVADPILAGRLTLSLLEIETYRLMALLAFPIAVEAGALLGVIESEVSILAARLADELGVEDDRALLSRLVALSGRMEALSASTSFRFAAARAYHEIVRNRIASLREAPAPGMQTIGQFMDRRLGPAMRTCQSIAEREQSLIERIGRAGQMLNTRIELVTQAINADLLASMNRRALAQLRLQRTVEGLSVAAITYYMVSLVTYPLAAAKRGWPTLDTVLIAGLLAPLIAAAVWFSIRRFTRGIDNESDLMGA
jgi:uncharacterized membrane-anchored protein